MSGETFTDRCGLTITREEAIQEAIDCIIRQGDEEPYVRAAVEEMSDAEIMVWLAHPDEGEFSEYLHRRSQP